VTTFVARHGDHSCQHVAFDTDNLELFRQHLVTRGGTPRGQTLVRNDGFGVLKQMFAKGYAGGHAGESSFPEYVERPKSDDQGVAITFSSDAGKGFYEQIDDAITAGDDEAFFDFSRMPTGWVAPQPTPLAAAR
jgi:hypothetical protein